MAVVVAFGGSCGSYLEETVTIADRLTCPASQLPLVGTSEVVGLGPPYDGPDSFGDGRHRQTACVKETSGETKY